jgi:hypothetical protein
MVIKTTFVHTGWSYGKGDDQYDNESLGSTETAVNLEKSVKISMRNKKNEHDVKMCSRQEDKNKNKNINDQGWTTIEANKRKPKSVASNNTSIDSIISSINIECNIDTNGTIEAKINSPIRNNRCTIPDKNVYDKNAHDEAYDKKTTYETNQQRIETARENEEKTETTRRTEKKTQETQQEAQRRHKITMSNKKNVKKAEEMKKNIATKSAEEEKEEIAINEYADNHKTRNESTTPNNNNNSSEESNKNGEENNDKNDTKKTNNGDEGNTSNNRKNKNNGEGNRTRVSILTPGEMTTYTFTIAWRPEHKAGQDGKIIIKMLMREMAHRTPQIIFHPTNSASSPVPRDIHNINNDFPNTSASYDDFFDQMRNRDNTNQRTFMKVTMPHNEKELQRKLHNYLYHNKLYMNSPFIDDNTLEQVGFIENGHSRLVHRPNLEMKIRNGLKEVMEGEMLTPQQIAQLKHLSSPIRVECHRGTIRAGSTQQQVICEGIVLKTTKSQSKIAMELLSMLPETVLGEHYRIIPKSLGNLLGYDLYGRIVADTIQFQDTLRPITIMHCHPSVFDDLYDSVKLPNSTNIKVNKFITDCCGAISIEETNETKEKGKYIVVVPAEKVDSARTAIGKMFQEFQQSGGRPAAIACLSAYQNYPLVNDNVTISGHAQRLSEKIRNRYQNRPKTPMRNRPSSASYSYHGSPPVMQDQRTPPQPTAVPRSIVRNAKHPTNATNGTLKQWTTTQATQQQQTIPMNQPEERTVMSNLSPDDSAKTMMTNVSRMVDTLGSVVNTLARESANTNDTIKQMMIQQTTTMNNLMMLMARNEERRQEIPIREIRRTSTPTSTITNSQFSLSQQSISVNKRKIDGIADDETTAISTVETGTIQMEDDEDMDKMSEQRNGNIGLQETETTDTTMTDNAQSTASTHQQQQSQQETTRIRNTISTTAGDVNQQFNIQPKRNETTKSTPTGVRRQ